MVASLLLSFALALGQTAASPAEAAPDSPPAAPAITHTGAGNIDVAQPAPDTIVVTMTGVAVAGAHPLKDSSATLTFQLDQSFEIVLDNPKSKHVKLTLEGRVIGLLRSHQGGGSAQHGPAHAAVACGGAVLLFLDVPR